MYSIRPFKPTKEEYVAIVALNQTIWPDERQFSVDMWRENDEEWPVDSLYQRFVVESNGEIVCVGACFEKYWQHQPGTVHIEFDCHPEHESSKLDILLYDHLLDFLGQQCPAPMIIATEAREDRPVRIKFLEASGFRPTMRSPRASLNLADFDRTPYIDLLEKVATQGISIRTLSEVRALFTDWKQRLYELRWAIIQDVPAVEPPAQPTRSEFEKMILEDPALNEEAWFIAIDESTVTSAGNGRFVGTSNLWLNDPSNERLDAGLTGVIRDYRRRRIATALKVHTIRFAQAIGGRTIETDNEESNPIYGINLGLGFKPNAAWISFRKNFD